MKGKYNDPGIHGAYDRLVFSYDHAGSCRFLKGRNHMTALDFIAIMLGPTALYLAGYIHGRVDALLESEKEKG
jgi:hypothetical protein